MYAERPDPGRGDLTLSGFVAAACVALMLAGAAYWLSLQQNRAAAWVSHTHEVLTSIARTRTALVDIQNGHRGFTISGQEEDLRPYLEGRAAIDREAARLRGFVADNPVQRQHMAELEAALAHRLASAAELVAARRSGGFDAAKSIVDTGMPTQQMTRLRAVLQELETEEERLLRQRLADHHQRLQWLWGGMAVIVLVLFAALAVLYLQVRRRRAAQLQLLESEHRFHLMTSSVLDYAIIMLDLQGCVRTWNAGAERITGYSGADVIIGRDFACFYTEEDARAGRPTRTLQEAAAQGRHAGENWLVRHDGSAFWASVVITPLRSAGGDLRGFSMIARDLTERRQAEHALRAEMSERLRIDEELQRLNRSLEALVRERTAELRAANADLLEAKLRLRDLSSQLITAQEQERRHIARELHDDTGQSMTVIRMHLMDMLRGKEDAMSRVPECIAVVDAAIAQIRGMALNLRPTMLDDLGLAEALEWALEQQAKAAGWVTALESDGDTSGLPPEIQTACFRIGQEALTNAARHAGATEVSLELRMIGRELELTVSDNGAGFDLARYGSPEERKKHFGLISMGERASLVGGRLEIETAPAQGTRVRAVFPVPVENLLADAALG
ncbi:CHASE3 domain-containing protein [Ramlibacter sp.]|uniref:CHASE3 domain-containing protein n=1 Tax=Ramlibacter sp. TaxID=1917967 RepID=UPI002CA54B6A|nr:CHASE3 domain-containing protein [Ramlibacter sp.]HWI84598.1 CHASE3 domain-containing protein [Ramlibacter sp.]